MYRKYSVSSEHAAARGVSYISPHLTTIFKLENFLSTIYSHANICKKRRKSKKKNFF